MGFLRQEVMTLSDILNKTVNVCSYTVNSDRNIHITNQDSIFNFINYIKDCEIPSCYSYKFPKELILK